MICPHCKQPFGYTIDGKFYPVAWHKHWVKGQKMIFLCDAK